MSNILISPPPTTLLTGLLQLDGGVAISSTPVYVADQTNTDSKLALSTTSVNINTLTGSALVNIKGTGATNTTSSLIVQNSAGTNTIQALDDTNVYMAKALRLGGGSITNTSGYLSMYNTGNSARIGPELFSTDSGSFTLSVLNGGPTLTMSVFGYANLNQNLGIGSPASITSRLHVKGSGSTSATTSLLVQNSSSTNLLKVTDDNVTSIIGRASVGVASINSSIWSAYTEVLQVGQLILGGYSPSPQAFLSNNSYFDGSNSRYFRTGGAGSINFTNNGSILFDMFASGTAGNVTSTSKQVYFDVSGNVGISTTSPTSRLHIVGSGSTSATTNLLVQNSSSTQLVKITDDGKLTMGTGSTGTALMDITIGSGSTPPLRLKGYSDASTPYLISLGTESYQQACFIKMINGSTIMQNQFDGFDMSFKTFNGGIMIKNSGAIGIGTDTPNTTAKVQIDSTTQGFLPPRMTTAQKLAILTPASGLMVYDTSLNQMSYFNGAVWVNI